MERTRAQNDNWQPLYSVWRHGGYYVTNVRYPSGSCGCVSNNYDDKQWRIVCDPRDYKSPEEQPTYSTRDAAARAERELVLAMHEKQKASEETPDDALESETETLPSELPVTMSKDQAIACYRFARNTIGFMKKQAELYPNNEHAEKAIKEHTDLSEKLKAVLIDMGLPEDYLTSPEFN